MSSGSGPVRLISACVRSKSGIQNVWRIRAADETADLMVVRASSNVRCAPVRRRARVPLAESPYEAAHGEDFAVPDVTRQLQPRASRSSGATLPVAPELRLQKPRSECSRPEQLLVRRVRGRPLCSRSTAVLGSSELRPCNNWQAEAGERLHSSPRAAGREPPRENRAAIDSVQARSRLTQVMIIAKQIDLAADRSFKFGKPFLQCSKPRLDRRPGDGQPQPAIRR